MQYGPMITYTKGLESVRFRSRPNPSTWKSQSKTAAAPPSSSAHSRRNSRQSMASGCMRWANVLSLRDYGRRNRLALELPSTLLSAPYDHLRFGELLVTSREGFVLPQRYKDHREHLQLMSGTEAIIDWFKRHDLTGTTSESGRNRRPDCFFSRRSLWHSYPASSCNGYASSTR